MSCRAERTWGSGILSDVQPRAEVHDLHVLRFGRVQGCHGQFDPEGRRSLSAVCRRLRSRLGAEGRPDRSAGEGQSGKDQRETEADENRNEFKTVGRAVVYIEPSVSESVTVAPSGIKSL